MLIRIIALILLSTPVHAGEIAGLSVSLWAEFDRPAVLVMYQVRLSSSSLPAQISLPVPAGVEPHAVAKRGPDGGLYLADHVRRSDGDWLWLDITTDSRDVQVEYYADLDLGAERREFVWEWPGGPAVDAATYELQVLRAARDVEVTPAWTTSEQDTGHVFYYGNIGPLNEGQSATVRFGYTVRPGSPIALAPNGASVTVVAAVAILGAVLLGLLVWGVRSRRGRARG